jgi:opacity protein-like surface antigen
MGLHGWNASVAANLNRWFGLVVDFSGHYDSSSSTFNFGPIGPGRSETGVSAHTFLVGPRFSYRGHDRLTPFGHILAGATRQHIENTTVIPRNGGQDVFTFSDNDTRFVGAIGGGLDVQLTDSFALRVIQADYQWTRLSGITQDNARVSTGIVFRFGR